MRLWSLAAGMVLPLAVAAQSLPAVKAQVLSQSRFADRRVVESSGAVASRAHPGWLWTMNDSGGDAMLFLTDSAGRALAALTVPGAANVDWEALGRGPCGKRECLYIGDTGDNGSIRTGGRLYRIEEPSPKDTAGRVTATAEALEIRYADGPHDVEALYVEQDGTCVLITKGWDGLVLELRVPADAWATGGQFTARVADTLAIPARAMSGRVVTDAALDPEGRHLVVRTYRELWFFRMTESGRPVTDSSRPVCDVAGLEPQGEGIDWWAEGTLLLTSERGLFSAGTVTLVRCPSP